MVSTAATYEWARNIRAVAVVPTEDLEEWCQLPTDATAPADLTFRLAERVCAAAAMVATSPSASLCPAKAVCQTLGVLNAVLAKGAPEIASRAAAELLPRLAPAYEVLARHAYAELLKPRGKDLEQHALQLPLLILTRCVDPEKIGISELLDLARGDLATGVAIATAVVSGRAVDWSPLSPQVQGRVWQMLYELTTAHGASEVLGTASAETNGTPIAELRAQQVAHLHRFAVCFLQFGTLSIACACAEEPQQRLVVLTLLLSTLHNLVAAPDLGPSGQLIGRHITAHWHNFGPRFLAPYLRTLLGAASSDEVAERRLHHDLMCLGWMLHHCPELRGPARPFCTELTLRALKCQHSVRVMAAATMVARNAGALAVDGPLHAAVQATNGMLKDELDEFDALGCIAPPGSLPSAAVATSFVNAETCRSSSKDTPSISELELSLANLTHERWDPYGLDYWEEPPDISPEDALGSTAEKHSEVDDAFQPLLPVLALPPPPPPWPTQACPDSTSSLPPVLTTPTALLCEVPSEFRCSIDGRLCSDPVRSPHGVLFERSQILVWLRWRKVCPVRGCPLSAGDLSEDVAVRTAICTWLAQSGIHAALSDH